jgi:hypothetical protein
LIAQGKFQPAGFAAPLGYLRHRLALAAAEDAGATQSQSRDAMSQKDHSS